MGDALRKTVFIVIFLAYYNAWIMLLAPGLYANSLFLFSIICYFAAEIADTIVRPITQEREKTRKAALMLLGFLMWQFFLVLAYYENMYFVSQYLAFLDNPITTYCGIGVIILGTIIIVASRVQLGIFATGRIVIEKDHKLHTGGLYKHIRDPICLGGMLVNVGVMIALRGFIFVFVQFAFGFALTRDRMETEERILLERFGNEYEKYRKRTSRLIPHLY